MIWPIIFLFLALVMVHSFLCDTNTIHHKNNWKCCFQFTLRFYFHFLKSYKIWYFLNRLNIVLRWNHGLDKYQLSFYDHIVPINEYCLKWRHLFSNRLRNNSHQGWLNPATKRTFTKGKTVNVGYAVVVTISLNDNSFSISSKNMLMLTLKLKLMYFNVYILNVCLPLSHRHEQTTQL